MKILTLIFLLASFGAGYLTGVKDTKKSLSPLPEWALVKAETHEKTNDLFNENLKKQFPIGSEESLLIKELQKSGFEKSWSSPDNNLWATHEEVKFPCVTDRSIAWQKNADNKITSISGTNWTTCP